MLIYNLWENGGKDSIEIFRYCDLKLLNFDCKFSLEFLGVKVKREKSYRINGYKKEIYSKMV